MEVFIDPFSSCDCFMAHANQYFSVRLQFQVSNLECTRVVCLCFCWMSSRETVGTTAFSPVSWAFPKARLAYSIINNNSSTRHPPRNSFTSCNEYKCSSNINNTWARSTLWVVHPRLRTNRFWPRSLATTAALHSLGLYLWPVSISCGALGLLVVETGAFSGSFLGDGFVRLWFVWLLEICSVHLCFGFHGERSRGLPACLVQSFLFFWMASLAFLRPVVSVLPGLKVCPFLSTVPLVTNLIFLPFQVPYRLVTRSPHFLPRPWPSGLYLMVFFPTLNTGSDFDGLVVMRYVV